MNNPKSQIQKQKEKGFTLIEMMVTTLIFSVVVGAVIGVFVSAVKLQKYNLDYNQLLNQTSYLMEYMSRAIRMAEKDIDGNCITANKNYEEETIPSTLIPGLMFEAYNNDCQGFFLENNQLKEYRYNSVTGSQISNLTSAAFEVVDFKYSINDKDPGNLPRQPRVTIYLKIKGAGIGYQPQIRIQTTISQRNLNRAD